MMKTLAAAACAAILAAAPAAAQQSADSVYELRAVEVAPRALNGADMAAMLATSYPAALRDAGVSGTVRVSIVVGADGVPRDARVVESADTAFNAPTLAAVGTLRFSPAQRNEAPVNVRVELPVVWRAPTPSPAIVASGPSLAAPARRDSTGAFRVQDVESSPRPTSVRALTRIMEQEAPPSFRNGSAGGLVQVRMRVDEAGVPSEVTVVRSENAELDYATVRVARRLRFRPAQLNGQPVAVWVELPIVWSHATAS